MHPLVVALAPCVWGLAKVVVPLVVLCMSPQEAQQSRRHQEALFSWLQVVQQLVVQQSFLLDKAVLVLAVMRRSIVAPVCFRQAVTLTSLLPMVEHRAPAAQLCWLQVLLLVVIAVPCWYHRVSPKPRTAATCALQLAKDLLVRAATSS